MQKISLVLLTTLLVAACGQATQPTNQESQNEIEEPIEVIQEQEPIESDDQITQQSTSMPTESVEPEPTPEITPAQETKSEPTPEKTSEEPATQTSSAQSESQETKTTKQAPLSETKEINLQGSLVEWLGEKIVGASHPGSFNLQSGEVTISDNKLQAGSFVIDINSLKSYEGISALEKHLLSDDFFDAGNFPTGKFQTTNISYTSPTQLNITGSLTLKGKTHTESFSATHNLETKTVTAKLNLDRTKYDIIFGSGKFFKELADAAIKDIIPLDITLKY